MVADFGESRFLLNPWEENMTKQPGEKSNSAFYILYHLLFSHQSNTELDI